MNNPSPRLSKILAVDFLAAVSALFPAIMWLFYLGMNVLEVGNGDYSGFALISAAVTAAGILVLGWRIQVFRSVFSDGQEAPATISNIVFFRDRGRVDTVYTYQGVKYVSSSAIMKTRSTEELRIGQEVTVLVDRNHPKRSFIRDLYV